MPSAIWSGGTHADQMADGPDFGAFLAAPNFPLADTLLVEGIRGSGLRVRFEKYTALWTVELHVRVALGDGPWVHYTSVSRLEQEHLDLWDVLEQMAHVQRSSEEDQVIERARAIFEGA